MNIVSVAPGDWFLIDANEPHCYLQGELVECMINSDNVVRGGLTPKLKDVDTLLSILPFENAQTREVWTGSQLQEGVLEYKPPGFDELRLFRIKVSH